MKKMSRIGSYRLTKRQLLNVNWSIVRNYTVAGKGQDWIEYVVFGDWNDVAPTNDRTDPFRWRAEPIIVVIAINTYCGLCYRQATFEQVGEKLIDLTFGYIVKSELKASIRVFHDRRDGSPKRPDIIARYIRAKSNLHSKHLIYVLEI